MSVTQLKPFNPIWGETFQCKIGETKLYLEQTSHHPPIFHFLVKFYSNYTSIMEKISFLMGIRSLSLRPDLILLHRKQMVFIMSSILMGPST